MCGSYNKTFGTFGLLPTYKVREVKMTQEQRFWSKVDISNPNGCWEWNAGCFSSGYGAFAISRNKKVYAHRLAWELTNGPIPEGMCVLHHCDNPKCCNAENTEEHLFLGTKKDNTQDMITKNRCNKISRNNGENNGRVKLTKEEIPEIIELRKEGYKLRELAVVFGVSMSQIGRIINGKRWSHIEYGTRP